MSRPTGSKNKVTLQTRKLLQNIVENNIDKIETELQTLSGKQFIDSIIKIIEFVTPKPKEEEEHQEIPKLQIKLTGLNESATNSQQADKV